MNREEAKTIRGILEDAVRTVSLKGYKVELGRCTFDDMGAEFRLNVKTITEDGIALGKEAADFKRAAAMFGLKPEDLGREFVCAGDRYRLTGYRARASAKPFLGARVRDGRTFIFAERAVIAGLATAKAEDAAAGKQS